jgi:hypothetical protein
VPDRGGEGNGFLFEHRHQPPTSLERSSANEHDHGPFNGFAEIVGSVIDSSGAVIPKAMAEVRQLSAGKTRQASTNLAGQFTLAGLAAGDYEVRVSSPGFQIAS